MGSNRYKSSLGFSSFRRRPRALPLGVATPITSALMSGSSASKSAKAGIGTDGPGAPLLPFATTSLESPPTMAANSAGSPFSTSSSTNDTSADLTSIHAHLPEAQKD